MILIIRKIKTQFWWVWGATQGRTRRGKNPTSPTQQEFNKLDEIRMHVINFSFI
ncbi:hypothetical protein Hanom_Chr12g01142521 [Helianthus anomalus]